MKTPRLPVSRHRALPALVALSALSFTIIPAAGVDAPLDLAALAAKPLDVASSYTTEVSLKSFKNTKKVVITMAAVTFKLESNISSKAVNVLGGSRTGIATNAMTMSLNGVSKEALQQIADAFHDQLEADFKAMGVEVVPTSALQASAKYAALAACNDDNPRKPYVNKNYGGTRATLITMTGHGLPLFGSGMTMIAPVKAMWALCTDLGEDVTAVYANVTVDFVQMGAAGGLLATTAEVSGKPLLNIPLWQVIGFNNPKGGGALGMKKPILIATDYGAQVKEASSVRLTDWFNGNMAGKSTYVVDADETKFKAGVGDMLKALSVMFTARIKDKSK